MLLVPSSGYKKYLSDCAMEDLMCWPNVSHTLAKVWLNLTMHWVPLENRDLRIDYIFKKEHLSREAPHCVLMRRLG